MAKFNFKKLGELVQHPATKKAGTVLTVLVAVLGAASSTISEMQKEKEFEEMKKTLSELQNK